MEQPSGVVPRSTNPFVTAMTSSVQPQASVNELATRPSDGARFVSTGVADNREREVSSSRAVGSVEQGSALTGQRAGDNVWAELQRLSLQMELLLTNARRSQDGAGSSCRSAQGSGDESGREARNPRVVRSGRSGYAAPHSSHRYDGERLRTCITFWVAERSAAATTTTVATPTATAAVASDALTADISAATAAAISAATAVVISTAAATAITAAAATTIATGVVTTAAIDVITTAAVDVATVAGDFATTAAVDVDTAAAAAAVGARSSKCSGPV